MTVRQTKIFNQMNGKKVRFFNGLLEIESGIIRDYTLIDNMLHYKINVKGCKEYFIVFPESIILIY